MGLDGRKIFIAGGSGFVGISLATQLVETGAQVSIVSRTKPKVPGPWTWTQWDGRTLGEWVKELNRAEALVNLAGRTVNCIKTPDHQDEILRSRVESTRILGTAVRAVAAPPPVWVQMSTAHLYGDPPSECCDEDSAEGIGFAPTIARAWEAEFAQSKLPEQRGVILRTSFVIGRDIGAGGGAMSTLSFVAKIGLGGRVGSGTPRLVLDSRN